MARVNHKLVKQRLNEKRSKITDRQFFTSRLFAGHLEDLAAAQTRRYHYNRRVRVNIYWNSKDSFFAATDNMSVKINAGQPFITKTKGRENRYQIILGVFAHELGHILYTDFLAGQTHHNYLGAHKWYPYPPVLTTSADARREKAFWEYVKEDAKNLEMAQYIAQYISNLIDDGYVEDRILANFPGKLGYGLEELREIHFEQIPTVTELIEKEDTEDRHIFESIAQIMLSYAKFGEIKYGEEPLSEERIQVVFSLISDIDAALMSRSGKERLAVVNTIIVRCWDYLEEFCEECKKRQEEAEAAGGTASIAQALSEKLQSIAGKFDETKHQAIIEMVINLVISLAATWKFGIVGCLIGTIVALFYRINALLMFAAKHILQRSCWQSYKKILINAVVLVGVLLAIGTESCAATGYLHVIGVAFVNALWIAALFVAVNVLFNFKEFADMFRDVKRRLFDR